MTRDSDFKKLVRQRMAATGQSYTAARAAIYRATADADLPMTRRAFGLKASYTAACGRRVDGYAKAPASPQVAMAAWAFADVQRYRRLKITGVGPGLTELATFVRAGATEQVLRMTESSTEVSVDHRRGTPSIDAVRTQRVYLAAARRTRHRRPEDDIILDAWQTALDSHDDGHDPVPGNQADIAIATAAQIETAVSLPPQTTRARLRGLFIKTAKDHRRNFTVDWAHLKLNDGERRTVVYWNPLDAHLDIAERLIASISGSSA